MPKVKQQSKEQRCSRVSLLHIFRTSFSKNTSGWLLLKDTKKIHYLKSFRLWNTNTFYAVIKRFFEEGYQYYFSTVAYM